MVMGAVYLSSADRKPGSDYIQRDLFLYTVLLFKLERAFQYIYIYYFKTFLNKKHFEK